jgi:hypothetical protein
VNTGEILLLLVTAALGIFCVWGLGIFRWVHPKAGPPIPVKVTNWDKRGKYDYILTVLWTSGQTSQYRGGVTVYHHYPSGTRCDTNLEYWLSGETKAIQWLEEGDEFPVGTRGTLVDQEGKKQYVITFPVKSERLPLPARYPGAVTIWVEPGLPDPKMQSIKS